MQGFAAAAAERPGVGMAVRDEVTAEGIAEAMTEEGQFPTAADLPPTTMVGYLRVRLDEDEGATLLAADGLWGPLQDPWFEVSRGLLMEEWVGVDRRAGGRSGAADVPTPRGRAT
ncbi:hypothetical protein [Pseudonocardia xishanensis]|uniref:YCII-related domain-containing protein n=1 Tax=Pseudonocardia xishanensis TaxID=630995 RepID=A0ABP8RQH6_9PSEU